MFKFDITKEDFEQFLMEEFREALNIPAQVEEAPKGVVVSLGGYQKMWKGDGTEVAVDTAKSDEVVTTSAVAGGASVPQPDGVVGSISDSSGSEATGLADPDPDEGSGMASLKLFKKLKQVPAPSEQAADTSDTPQSAEAS